jgi:hypothetical protein
MTSTRSLVLAAGLLGLGALAALAHRGSLTVPAEYRAALTGVRAALHEELERLEGAALASRGWESMIAVGGAFLAIPRVGRPPAALA